MSNPSNPAIDKLIQRLSDTITGPVVTIIDNHHTFYEDYLDLEQVETGARNIKTFDSASDALTPIVDAEILSPWRSPGSVLPPSLRNKDRDDAPLRVHNPNKGQLGIAERDFASYGASIDVIDKKNAIRFWNSRRHGFPSESYIEMFEIDEKARPLFEKLGEIIREHDGDGGYVLSAKEQDDRDKKASKRLAALFGDAQDAPKTVNEAIEWMKDPVRCPYVKSLVDPDVTRAFEDAAREVNPDFMHELGDTTDKVISTIAKRKADLDASMDAHTSPETLDELSRSPDSQVRENVAKHPATSSETLFSMLSYEDDHLDRAIAGNPNTPPEALTKLIVGHSGEIVRNIAGNPNTPPEILTKFAHEEAWVRPSVALNPNASQELLAELAEDEDNVVRAWVAWNPNTSLEVLSLLAKDENFLVREKVASNPKTSLDLLSTLAKDEHPNIRSAIAENAKTPPEMLSQLAGDENHLVRRAVCMNEHTPLADVIGLAKDNESEYVRDAALDALSERSAQKAQSSPTKTLQASAAKVKQNETGQSAKLSGPTNPDC